MTRIRRAGLMLAGALLVAAVVAAFATEGYGLALIVLIGALMVVGLVVPLLSVFEEERDLPYARSRRSHLG